MKPFKNFLTTTLLIVLCSCSVLITTQGTVAQSSERNTVEAVRTLLDSKQFEKARNVIKQQISREAENPLWRRLMARLHIKTSNISKADRSLEEARRLGDGSPEWHYLKGITSLKQLRPKTALNHFQQAPKQPELNVWKAEAHVQLGNNKKARTLIETSIGNVPEQRKRLAALLNTIESEDDMDTSSRMLGTREEHGKQSGHSYAISVTSGGGYNDNVSARPEQSFLGTDISQQKDHFHKHSLYAWTELHRTNQSALFMYGKANSKEYEDLSGFDELSYNAGLQYTHLMDKREWITVGGGYKDVELGRTSYSSQVNGKLAYHYQVSSQTEWATEYRFTLYDYHDDPPPDEDRDGPVHELYVRPSFTSGDSEDTVIITPFGQIGTSKTDGNDMENEFFGGGGNLTVKFNQRLAWNSYFKYRHRKHVNDRIVGGFNVGKRNDDERYYLTKLIFKLDDHVTLSTRYTHQNNNSNFQLFTFEQDEVFFNVTIYR